MGAWMTVMPLARAAATTFALFSSIPVSFMDSATAPCSLPPSVVNSFLRRWRRVNDGVTGAGAAGNGVRRARHI